MATHGSETGECSTDFVVEVDPVDQEEEKGMIVMSSRLGEGSSLTNLGGNPVLGGDGNKGGRNEKRNRSMKHEEQSLVVTESSKPREKEIEASINSTLPPELLSAIFRFLPLKDLKLLTLAVHEHSQRLDFEYSI